MKKLLCVSILFSVGVDAGAPVCTPGVNTSFQDFENQAFSISYDALGQNSLYRQCTNMSNQVLIDVLDTATCGALQNPIDGLGLSPIDHFLYGLMPTDTLGIGAHIEFDLFPFPSPGNPGDMMKADPVNVYRIGNDGGYQNIGQINPAPEEGGLPNGTHQVIPTVHTAASFDQLGNLFLLGYKTNYSSSADVMAGTGEVLYQTPRIMIGQVTAANLTVANGTTIPANWSEANTTNDATCAAVMDQFRDRTNAFSACVVADYITNGNEDGALQSCLASTGVLDYGIHDFAVSPINGNYYALDSTSFDTTDVLIEVDSKTMQASCTNFDDLGSETGVLTSLMFSQQNKLVAVFANENTGRWIDVNTGNITTLTDSIDPFPFGDGSSLPFTLSGRLAKAQAGAGNFIFSNGFESDLIFANDFEGVIQPPTCPAF